VTCLAPGASATGFAQRANAQKSLLFGKLPTAKAASVARAGYLGMMAGRDLVIPGVSNQLVALGARLSPRKLLIRMSRRSIE
jgi:hypothetical protein